MAILFVMAAVMNAAVLTVGETINYTDIQPRVRMLGHRYCFGDVEVALPGTNDWRPAGRSENLTLDELCELSNCNCSGSRCAEFGQTRSNNLTAFLHLGCRPGETAQGNCTVTTYEPAVYVGDTRTLYCRNPDVASALPNSPPGGFPYTRGQYEHALLFVVNRSTVTPESVEAGVYAARGVNRTTRPRRIRFDAWMNESAASIATDQTWVRMAVVQDYVESGLLAARPDFLRYYDGLSGLPSGPGTTSGYVKVAYPVSQDALEPIGPGPIEYRLHGPFPSEGFVLARIAADSPKWGHVTATAASDMENSGRMWCAQTRVAPAYIVQPRVWLGLAAVVESGRRAPELYININGSGAADADVRISGMSCDVGVGGTTDPSAACRYRYHSPAPPEQPMANSGAGLAIYVDCVGPDESRTATASQQIRSRTQTIVAPRTQTASVAERNHTANGTVPTTAPPPPTTVALTPTSTTTTGSPLTTPQPTTAVPAATTTTAPAASPTAVGVGGTEPVVSEGAVAVTGSTARTVASVGAAAGSSPGAAMQASRALAVLDLARSCELLSSSNKQDGDPIAFPSALWPGLAFDRDGSVVDGSSGVQRSAADFHRGALVSNLGGLLVVVLLSGAASCLLGLLTTTRDSSKIHRIGAGAAKLRLPAMLVVPVGLLCDGLVSSAVALSSGAANHDAAGVSPSLLDLALAGCTWVVVIAACGAALANALLWTPDYAVYVEPAEDDAVDGSPTPRVRAGLLHRILRGAASWTPRSPRTNAAGARPDDHDRLALRCCGKLFDKYRGPVAWFLALDIALSVLASGAKGLSGSPHISCEALLWFVMGVTAIGLLLAVAVRPYIAPFRTWVFALVSLCTLVASALVAVGFHLKKHHQHSSEDAADELIRIGETFAFAAVIVTIVASVVAALRFGVDLFAGTGRPTNDEAGEEKASGQGADEPDESSDSIARLLDSNDGEAATAAVQHNAHRARAELEAALLRGGGAGGNTATIGALDASDSEFDDLDRILNGKDGVAAADGAGGFHQLEAPDAAAQHPRSAARIALDDL